MPNSRPLSEKATRLLIDSLRSKRSQLANQNMLKEGQFWYLGEPNEDFEKYENITDAERNEFIQALTQAKGFKYNIKSISWSNFSNLFSRVGRMSPEESSFLDYFMNAPFYAVHASQAQLQNESNDLVIYSRRMLERKRIDFPEDNSMFEDTLGIAADDHVFFSLEVGSNLHKPFSRFGNKFFKIKFDNPIFLHSSMVLVDQYLLYTEIRSSRIPGLSATGYNYLLRRTFDFYKVCFSGRALCIHALGLSIIDAARNMRIPEDKQLILSTRGDANLSKLINCVFRPEIRVPRIAAVKSGQFSEFARVTVGGQQAAQNP